ncbi:MAG: hypothetical protein GY930_01255 [bacterium]|nr:hypothetical protein [bacterium]
MSKTEYFYTASYVFERARGRVMDTYELNSIAEAGLDQRDPEDIRSEIEEQLTSGNLNADERSTACFALGKTLDSSLVPLFQQQLRLELKAKSSAVYQLLICLSDLDENVFGVDRDGSFSAMDVELNLRDAEAYLGDKV